MTQPNKVYPVDAIKNGARSTVFNISHRTDADDRERYRQVAAEHYAKLEDIGRCGMQVVTNEVLRAYSFDYVKLSATAPGPYPDVQIIVSLRGVFPQDEDVQYISEELSNYFTPNFDGNRITTLSPTSITTLTGLTAALLAWGLQEPVIEAVPAIDELPASDVSFALPAGDDTAPVSAEDVVAIASEPDKGVFTKTMGEATGKRSLEWMAKQDHTFANGSRFEGFPASPGRQGGEKLQEYYQQISTKIRSIDHMRAAYDILTIGEHGYQDVQFSVFPFINLANELTVIIYPDAEIPDIISVIDRLNVIGAIVTSVVEHYFRPDVRDAKLAEAMISYHQLPWTDESLIAAIESAIAGESGTIKCFNMADLADAVAEFAPVKEEIDGMFSALAKVQSHAVSAVVAGYKLGTAVNEPSDPLTPEEIVEMDKADDEFDALIQQAVDGQEALEKQVEEMEVMFPAATKADGETLADSVAIALKGGLKLGEATILSANATPKSAVSSEFPEMSQRERVSDENIKAMRAGLSKMRSEQVAIGHALRETCGMSFHDAAYFACAVSSEIISRNAVRIACEFISELVETSKICAANPGMSNRVKDKLISDIGYRYVQFDPRLLSLWTAWITHEAVNNRSFLLKAQKETLNNELLNSIEKAMFAKFTSIDAGDLSVYAIAFRKMIVERGIDHEQLSEVANNLLEDDEHATFTFDYCLKRWFAKDLSLDIFIEAMDCLRVLKKL